jgi:hypothetical protein
MRLLGPSVAASGFDRRVEGANSRTLAQLSPGLAQIFDRRSKN